MKTSNIVMVTIAIILLGLLVWGLIGSSRAAKNGIDCDIGIGKDGSVFCWTWHQNIVGDAQDIGDEIKDLFNN